MNLTEYMTETIENIIQDACKATLKNPKESAFLLKFSLAAQSAANKRRANEAAGDHIPPFLIASISSACNLFCKGCYARANQSCGENCGAKDLTDEQWQGIFEQAAELGIPFILLAGGEPLMRMDVLQKAASCRRIAFPVFTNGTMLNGAVFDLFERSRNLIPILSIEGGRQQTDSRRGSGVYEVLRSTMRDLNRNGLFYGASVTVTTKNLSTITSPEFLDGLYQNGCKLVFFVEYVPVENPNDVLTPGEKERTILAEKLKMLRQKYKMIFLSFPGDEKRLGGCLAAGRGFFHISSAGAAEPCPFSPYSDLNLKNCRLKEALRSPLFRRLNGDGILTREHTGGCVLYQNRNEVRKLASE